MLTHTLTHIDRLRYQPWVVLNGGGWVNNFWCEFLLFFFVLFCLFFLVGGVKVQLFQICGNAGAFYWRFFWLVEPVEWMRKIQKKFNYFKYVATLEPFIGDFFDWWSRWSGRVKYKWRPKKTQKKTFYRFFLPSFLFLQGSSNVSTALPSFTGFLPSFQQPWLGSNYRYDTPW